MSTSDKNDVDAQEIPLDQLGEVAGGDAGRPGGAPAPAKPGPYQADNRGHATVRPSGGSSGHAFKPARS